MISKHNFKRIATVTLVVLSLFFAMLGMAFMKQTAANAEEIPTVTDGSKIEMESVVPNGTPTGDNESFIIDKATASGEKCVGNWGNGNNNVTYKFKLEKAKKAKIGIALVTGWGGTQLITKVNGTSVSFETSFDAFTDYNNGWYNFKVYYLKEVELKADENELYLEAYEGSNFNFDYITFTFTGDVVEKEIPTVTDGSKIEMESVIPNGTPTNNNDSFIIDKATASGEKCVGNWGKGDNNVTYKFKLEKAQKAKIGVALVTGWGGTQLITKVNGTSVSFETDFDAFTDYDNGWYNFKVYYLQEVELKASENTLYLEAYEGSYFNFDYITFKFSPEVHVCEHVCEICGKCTNFACAEEACVSKCEGHSQKGDHTHTFVNGVCACGDLKIEIESVTPNGTPTDPNGTFVFDKATASGGKVIGNWGKGDTNVTYTFTLTEARYAKIGIALVTGWSNTELVTKVNDVSVNFETKFDAFTDYNSGWYNFKVYYLKGVDLKAGENKIYIEACEGSNFNFDYILVESAEKPAHVCEHVCEICGKCTDETCEDEVCKDKCQGHHAHDFKDGRCSCGAYILEAEDTDYNSTIESTDTSGAGVIVEETELASGGKCVGNWGKAGNKIVWNVELGKAANAPIVIRMAPCSPAANFSDVIKLTVNDKVIALKDNSIPGLVGTGWYDFKDFETEIVAFPQGKVQIVMEMLGSYFTNVDCIILGVSSDVEVTVAADPVKPEISDITIDSTELVAGKEISFSYTASDNVTAKENLIITEKVYLNYNKDGQEEVACNSGKFTPAKAGRYTIVITVTDEAGNTETKTRSLTVDEADQGGKDSSGGSGTSSGSDKTSGGGSSKKDDEKQGCFGAIDMGYVVLPMIIALVAVVIVKRRKIRDR